MQTLAKTDGLRELTIRGFILGAIITVIFTASNVYLGLKVGLTVASSIPAAVISMAVLQFFKGHNILENNMVQTQASSAGTLSSVIFVIPGLLMLGYWQGFPFFQTLLICMSGGILGVIFTIPLRHAMVVNTNLPYPEGVAAAEILKAGAHQGGDSKNESGIKEIAFGGVIAAIVAFLTNGLRVMADGASLWFKSGAAIFQVPMGFSLALLGAGYLVGIVGGFAVLLGIFLAWGIAVPYFSAQMDASTSADMVDIAWQIWKEKVRFIGVGTMGVAAVWTLLSLLKPMLQGLKHSFMQLKDPKVASSERIYRDLSPKSMIYIVLLAVIVIMVALWNFIADAPFGAGLAIVFVIACTLLAVIIGFFVAAACGYMAGLVGSSSSPISGIGIISVLVVAVILYIIGQATDVMQTADGANFVTALTIFTCSIVVCIAAISNDNLQDLKTGLLVEATPARQQIALIVGCVVGALVIAPILEVLYNAYGFTGALPRADMDPTLALSAPQATLMTTIANGIFNSDLEWTYILIGIGIGVALIIIDFFLKKSSKSLQLPPLAVGMGIYLPPSINAPIVVGAFMAYLIKRHLKKFANKRGLDEVAMRYKADRFGTLFAAGLIVGESLMGVVLAMIIAGSVSTGGAEQPLALELQDWGSIAQTLGLVTFVVVAILYAKRILRAKKQVTTREEA